MVLGIGTDILEIERIKKAVSKQSFLKKIFTDNEITYFFKLSNNNNDFNQKAYESIAGNFTVKEAVSKAFGTGFTGFSPRDIEVLRGGSGEPYINLFHGALVTKERLNINKIHVSMSHCKDYAIAYVIMEGENFENSFIESN